MVTVGLLTPEISCTSAVGISVFILRTTSWECRGREQLNTPSSGRGSPTPCSHTDSTRARCCCIVSVVGRFSSTRSELILMIMTGPTTVFHPTAFDWRPPTLRRPGRSGQKNQS